MHAKTKSESLYFVMRKVLAERNLLNILYSLFGSFCLRKAHCESVCVCVTVVANGLSHRLPVSRFVHANNVRCALIHSHARSFPFCLLPPPPLSSAAAAAAKQMKNILMKILHLRIRVIALWQEV